MPGFFGVQALADNLEAVSAQIQTLRWKMRLNTAFNPSAVEIPRRFTEVTTSKGKWMGISSIG